MKHYKGYWSFAPMPEMTTHIVEAENYDEAETKLIAWARAHRGYVDCPFDVQIECLDGYQVICKTYSFFKPKEDGFVQFYRLVNYVLRKSVGDNIVFEYVDSDEQFSTFTVFKVHESDYDRLSLQEANDVKAALCGMPQYTYMVQLSIEEVTYDGTQE
jgi:hypothetical protein